MRAFHDHGPRCTVQPRPSAPGAGAPTVPRPPSDAHDVSSETGLSLGGARIVEYLWGRGPAGVAGPARSVAVTVVLSLVLVTGVPLGLSVTRGAAYARAQSNASASPARVAEAMGSCLPIRAVRPAANRMDVVLVDVENDPELIYIPFVDPRAPELLRWVVDATPPGDGLGQPITLTVQRAEGGEYAQAQHPDDAGLQLVLPSYAAPSFVPTEAARRAVEDVSARATACFTSVPVA